MTLFAIKIGIIENKSYKLLFYLRYKQLFLTIYICAFDVLNFSPNIMYLLFSNYTWNSTNRRIRRFKMIYRLFINYIFAKSII